MPHQPSNRSPAVIWAYGLAGLIPFVAGALGVLIADGVVRTLAVWVLTAYGALILSFLGGARWGLEIGRTLVLPRVISAAMAPTLAGFFLLAVPHLPAWVRLAGLACAFVAQWVWDVRSPAAPEWYPRLRTMLSDGALLCLAVGAVTAD